MRVGLTSSRALANTFALVHSIIQLLQPPSFLFFLTLNHLLGLPVGWKERLAKVLQAKGMPQDLLISPAMLQFESKTCHHLASGEAPSPQHSSPPQRSDSWLQIPFGPDMKGMEVSKVAR